MGLDVRIKNAEVKKFNESFYFLIPKVYINNGLILKGKKYDVLIKIKAEK